MKVLQINSTVNSGSTGRIAEDIGLLLLQQGHESYLAYGHGNRPSSSHLFKVGNEWDRRMHGLKSRLLDLHGLGSVKATKAFIRQVEVLQPDLIHLHNIHGYYMNIRSLFDFLGAAGIPVVWTLHDCWPFTGHCTYFDRYACDKWQHECHHCPNIHGYPQSWLIDNSRSNYWLKKQLFNAVKAMSIVTPSQWLAHHVKSSFLKNYKVEVIHNGVNTDVFKPWDASVAGGRYAVNVHNYVLGVANVWDRRKGLGDFIRLREKLDASIGLLLVGLTRQQICRLPKGIKGIPRTERVEDLATLYAGASAFVNPTYIDNFPTTNLEALACGTPVVTYNTGGSPEAVEKGVGYVVEQGDVDGLALAVRRVLAQGTAFRVNCRLRVENFYDKNDRLQDYLALYKRLCALTSN
jgi:putative colanic acid biosynthesis glycosyltransferase